MKPNVPSLILYFVACGLLAIFKLLEYDSYVDYVKSVNIPLIFIYYFITNNYKITFIKASVFFLCFIGDVINMFDFYSSHLLVIFSFLFVYILLLKPVYDDFKSSKFVKKDWIPIIVSLLFVVVILFSVLSLQFENMLYSLSLYVVYGIVLGSFVFISIINYIKKTNFALLNLVIFCLCSMISDIFYMINKFYLNLFAFDFIQEFVQVLSYFFLATYFIENDNFLMKQKESSKF